jgi:hypothetical protein
LVPPPRGCVSDGAESGAFLPALKVCYQLRAHETDYVRAGNGWNRAPPPRLTLNCALFLSTELETDIFDASVRREGEYDWKMPGIQS